MDIIADIRAKAEEALRPGNWPMARRTAMRATLSPEIVLAMCEVIEAGREWMADNSNVSAHMRFHDALARLYALKRE